MGRTCEPIRRVVAELTADDIDNGRAEAGLLGRQPWRGNVDDAR
jgi:hypothetical protein